MQANPLTSPRYEPHTWHYLANHREVQVHLFSAHNWSASLETASEMLAIHRELHELAKLERGGATAT